MAGGSKNPHPSLDVDPFDEKHLREHDEFQRALREAGPFVYLTRYGIWATGRYKEVREILIDSRTFCSSGGVGLANFHKEKPWRRPSLLLEQDPPEHTRARAVLMRALSPAHLARLRAAFDREARKLVDQLLERGRFDAMSELAERFPLQAFGDAVGIAPGERRTLLEYGAMSFNALGPRNALFNESMKSADQVCQWIEQSCARDALDRDGLGAIMYQAADEGAVTEDEAGMLVRSFLSAGVDTTARALGGALECFARQPEQWALLRARPERAKAAADEAIRYVSPFQTVFRTTTVRFDHEAGAIAPDEKLFLSLGAANRDPRRWERPDTFDITRRTAGHVGFGAGIHGCVGQALARIEIEAMLAVLGERVQSIDLDGEPVLALNNTVRGFSRLPLAMRARARASA